MQVSRQETVQGLETHAWSYMIVNLVATRRRKQMFYWNDPDFSVK